jgi:RNA polymerase sigma-70 factor (ECF subfamily)
LTEKARPARISDKKQPIMPIVRDDSIPTRASLLIRLKDWDDQASWQTFYDTYWKLIYGVSRQAGLTETEAEDVTQDTIVTVAKKMKEFRYDPALGSFKGWLLHTTRWRIRDRLRARPIEGQSQPDRPDDTSRTATVERVPDPATLNVDAIWDREWQASLLDAALERVKHKVNALDFQIYDVTELKGWSVQEARQTLGVSSFQVYNARSRVARRLRTEVRHLETHCF